MLHRHDPPRPIIDHQLLASNLIASSLQRRETTLRQADHVLDEATLCHPFRLPPVPDVSSEYVGSSLEQVRPSALHVGPDLDLDPPSLLEAEPDVYCSVPAVRRCAQIPDACRIIRVVVEVKGYSLCHSGKKATMTVRVDAQGRAVQDGPQVEIGGNERYVSVSRAEFKRVTRGETRIE